MKQLVTITMFLLASSGAFAQVGVDDAPGVIHQVMPEMVIAVEAPEEVEPIVPLSVTRPDLAARLSVTDLGPVPANRFAEEEFLAELEGRRDSRVGVLRYDVTPMAVHLGDADERGLDDGTTVWTMGVRSPAAKGLRLHFTNVDLGDAEMLVFADGPHGLVVRGPYTGAGPIGTGEFWSHYIPGDRAFIEIRGTELPTITLDEVCHFDRGLFEIEDGGDNGNGVFSCHLDAMCESVNNFARLATGQMTFMSGGQSSVCSGTLINDQDNSTQVPYFMTAAHCVNSQSEVNSLQVTWLWQRNGCGGPLPDMTTLPTSLGGALLWTSGENDASFIRLNGGAPPGTAFAGWTTETSLDNAHSIHHPSGSWKRATFLSAVGVCPGCLCEDGTDFDYYDMDQGLVEGGSSGGGIFNSSGQLSGQLLGRCSDTTDPDDMNCGNIDSFWAMYGEFEETYPNISNTLAIGGTMWVWWAGVPPGTGAPNSPFTTVGLAHAVAWNGLNINILAGSYNETLTLNKQVTLIAQGGTVTIGAN